MTPRHAVTADEQATRLKASEGWLKDTVLQVRAERFRPIADQARDLWEQLRQESSVQLDDVMLAGSATQRRLELSVSVDGSDSSALGVMSQGERTHLRSACSCRARRCPRARSGSS